MNKLMKLGAALLLSSATYAFALTPDEVKDHVLSAKAYCAEKGVEVCIAEIGKKGGMFDKGELYIWANDFDGVITAHPKKPIAGKNLMRYKDKAGNQVFKSFIDQIKAGNEGWSADYYWANSQGKQQLKNSYIIKIGDNQLIGAGIHK